MPARHKVMEAKQPAHEPVMAEEILQVLPLRAGSLVVDGTVGLGGHARRFLERIEPGGHLVAMDWDGSMLSIARGRLGEPAGATVEFVNRDFREMAQVLGARQADAILLDLGLNSAQVDDASRGISFLHDGPLDMRMDRTKGEPAAAMLNRLGPQEIEQILWDLGDERWARAIARKIVERRKQKPLRTTADLVESVLAAVPAGARDRRIHPATRTFQAIRIQVNQELEGLDQALQDAARCLAPGGVLAVLSYHSGEDRIVKQAFRLLADEGFADLYRKPLLPQEAEIRRNPRSRSAKLRALARVAESEPGKEP
ncbi:MAG TPA: 16S rRNA (cytosine(1402)-N(4))-methyltransferase RsmH [Fimbriimonadaceae bacterium]|nr:16S rRNA (cytosine(1402)-N(4))-methyltransferase RsmH [Fimbriimonadaceae bacterium]